LRWKKPENIIRIIELIYAKCIAFGQKFINKLS